MSLNILVTGAAGYIAGTIVNSIVTGDQSLVKTEQIVTAVRTEEQAQKLSALGVKAACVDLSSEKQITDLILEHDIGLVVHCASCLDFSLAKPLISGLSTRSKQTGKPGSFIHTSGASAFADKTGWPFGQVKDTESVVELIKQVDRPYPIRQTDLAVLDYAQENNVKAFIIVPAQVYARGTGPGNQLSIVLPMAIRAFIASKAVYKFPDAAEWSAVHVVDLADYYIRFMAAVAGGQSLPSDKEGFYFPVAHTMNWEKTLEHIAAALHDRGLISQPGVAVWPSEEVASETLGLPAAHVQLAFNSTSVQSTGKSHLIGWVPKSTEKSYLEGIEDEVQAVVDPNTSWKMTAMPKKV